MSDKPPESDVSSASAQAPEAGTLGPATGAASETGDNQTPRAAFGEAAVDRAQPRPTVQEGGAQSIPGAGIPAGASGERPATSRFLPASVTGGSEGNGTGATDKGTAGDDKGTAGDGNGPEPKPSGWNRNEKLEKEELRQKTTQAEESNEQEKQQKDQKAQQEKQNQQAKKRNGLTP